MRTPPAGLDVTQLLRLLSEAWLFPATELRYAPVGFGSHHWVATDADGDRRFVTVDELDELVENDELDENKGSAGRRRLRTALCTAHALRTRAGLGFVVAPSLTADLRILRNLDDRFAMSVTPAPRTPRSPGVHSSRRCSSRSTGPR